MKKADISKIKVYNTKGLVVKTFTDIQFLDISELKPGLYLIEFFSKNAEIKRQLVNI